MQYRALQDYGANIHVSYDPYHCLSQLNVGLFEAKAAKKAFYLLWQVRLSCTYQKLVLLIEVIKLDSDREANPAYAYSAHHSSVAQLLGDYFLIKMHWGLVTKRNNITEELHTVTCTCIAL